ncbi:MAG TPA: amidohydrolase family protein [Clostridia bacterium]|nr:amidohydrolase [Clostridiaceae bacterium]HOF26569.1 amidohydrolase family protein [Clostridia bacterium]HOM34529.1 amidohydrolase family protein [Clostridia bacterium]HOR90037.1 amidohydrolase family protein [Clostridia bacterium]HOT70346.1 amidohydrolase family protein [Clostridia bacterium]
MNGLYKIADSHTHIYPDKIAMKASKSIGDFYGIPMFYNGTVKELLENGSRINIKKYLVCSVSTTSQQVISINDFIISQCLEHEEFVGLAAMHQDFNNVEKELERVAEQGLKGIKMHHDFQKVYSDDERFFRTYKKAEEAGMVCLLHAGDDRYDYTRPKRIISVMEKFPNLKCIAAHFGGYKCWEEAYKTYKGTDNLYFDTSSSLYSLKPDEARDIIREFGSDRFLFGTDYPMWDAKTELERFLSLNLTERENSSILYDNFINLFNL